MFQSMMTESMHEWMIWVRREKQVAKQLSLTHWFWVSYTNNGTTLGVKLCGNDADLRWHTQNAWPMRTARARDRKCNNSFKIRMDNVMTINDHQITGKYGFHLKDFILCTCVPAVVCYNIDCLSLNFFAYFWYYPISFFVFSISPCLFQLIMML